MPERLDERDARAVALAEARWPGRYIGDLTTAEWRLVYEALDHPEVLGVARPERHSEAYDPGPRRRIGGQYFDVDDVPPRGDRDY